MYTSIQTHKPHMLVDLDFDMESSIEEVS